MQIERVLCAVDFSEPSEEAARFAVDVARQYGAELTLLHVYAVPGFAYPEGVIVAAPDVMNDVLAEIERSLDRWKKEAQGRGAKNVKTATRQGAAASEIVRYAEEEDIDLIVVGTHGRGGIAHVLLGSVAEKVVRRAPCPVLSVRAPEPRHADSHAP